MKLTVRKKTISDYPLTEHLNTMFDDIKRKLPDHYGILTASNSNHFPGLQLLLYSLLRRYEIPIHVINVGMNRNQLKWLENLPFVTVSDLYEPPIAKIEYWEAWVKPWYILNSPFKKTIWIDADTIVTGELMTMIDEEVEDKPFFTADHTGKKEGIYNRDALYALLPIQGITKDHGHQLNTGVFIIDLERDSGLINEWTYCVLQAVEKPEIAEAILCWDQGACKWAMQKLKMTNCINDNKIYNFPARSRQCAFPANLTSLNAFVSNIKKAVEDKVVIFHWMGSPKPWVNWSDVLPITNVFAQNNS